MEHSRAEHSPSFARSTSNALIEIHSRVADLLPGTWGVCVTRRAAKRNCCSSFPRSLIAGIFFSPILFFLGWPKVRAYKKKIHTLGRQFVGSGGSGGSDGVGSVPKMFKHFYGTTIVAHAIAGKFFTRKAMLFLLLLLLPALRCKFSMGTNYFRL